MKKIIALALVLVMSTAIFTACGKQEVFEKVDVTTTTTEVQTKKDDEPATEQVLSQFSVSNVKFGMTPEQVYATTGVDMYVKDNTNGIIRYSSYRTGLKFLNKDAESEVYYVFNSDESLIEILYLVSADKGFDLNKSIAELDKTYKKHATYNTVKDGSQRTNYIWFKDDAYIVIAVEASGRTAVSYFAESYFNETNAEEVEAYKKL